MPEDGEITLCKISHTSFESPKPILRNWKRLTLQLWDRKSL